MAIPLRKVRDRVRGRLNDTDARRPTFVVPQLDSAICDAYLALSSMIPAPTIYTASAFTISAGAETFTLPTTATTGWTGGDGEAEYAGMVQIQLVSTGTFLQPISNAQMHALRSGQTSVVTGIPERFALYEASNQQVNGWCYPGAKVAQACNLYRSLLYDDLRDYVGAGTDDLDDVEVQFSRLGVLALVQYAASCLLGQMTDEDAQLRRIDKSVAALWRKEAWDLAYGEAMRRHNLEDPGIGVERWEA